MFSRLGVLHNDGAYAVTNVLASVSTFFEAVEDLVPAQLLKCVRGVLGDRTYGGEIKLVAFFFNVVTFNDESVDLLGLLEVFKLAHNGAKEVAAANKILGILNC